MKIHSYQHRKVAEIKSQHILISKESDVIEILEELFAVDASIVILFQHNLPPEFFDLKTGLAGSVLQKFSNYHIKVGIVGDFEHISSKSLQAFITESNCGRQVAFLATVDAVLKRLLNLPPENTRE